MPRTLKIGSWIALALTAALVVFYYAVVVPGEAASGSIADRSRGLGGPLALWMNGRLALFFNLKVVGPINWLVLPLLAMATWNWKRLGGWLRAGVLIHVSSVVIVGALGYFNHRYAYTLVPVTLMAILYGILRLFGRAGPDDPTMRMVLPALVLISWGATGWSYVVRLVERGSEQQERAALTTVGPVVPTADAEDLLRGGMVPIGKVLDDLKVPRDVNVLVNNLPVFYYSTDRRGIYYWCGFDGYFSERGQRPLIDGRTDPEVVAFLLDSLDCPYVFSMEEYTRHNERFASLLNEQAELLYRNARGYTVHRMRATLERD